MALTGVLEILSDDFANRFMVYIDSENAKSLFTNRSENLTNYIMEVLPPLATLKIGASGESSEKEVFEGVLMYCIIQLNAQGKIPGNYIDSIIHFASSYFKVNKLIPIINIKEDED
jgi:hypothetical protein